jgi:hypothetical protein
MPAGNPARPLDAVTRRLRDLAHRRLAYYAELSESGRWKQYFTELDFIARLRDVIADANAWNALAGHSDEPGSDSQRAA